MERSPLQLLAMLSEKPLLMVEVLLVVVIIFFASQALASFIGFGVTGGFLKGNQPPEVKLLSPVGGEEWSGEEIVKWKASDPDGDLLSYTLKYSEDGENWILIDVVDKRVYRWDTSMVRNGDCWLRVEASDGKKVSVDTSGRFTINNLIIKENKAPVVTIDTPEGDQVITVGETVSFRGTATDSDGYIVSYTWDFDGGASKKYMEDPGEVIFSREGNYHVTFNAKDDGGLWSSDSVNVVVRPANHKPSVTLLSPIGGEEWSGTQEITWKASDLDRDPLTFTIKYSKNNGNTWSILTRTNLTFYKWDTSSVYNGNYYKIKVEAFDGIDKSESVSGRFSIINLGSKPSNQPPVASIVSPSSDVIVALGDSVLFEGNSLDTDGYITAWFWDFDGGATNAFVEDPGYVKFKRSGSYDISFNVRDNNGMWSISYVVRVIVVSGFKAQISLPNGWEQWYHIDGEAHKYEGQEVNLKQGKFELKKANWGVKFKPGVSSDVTIDLSDAMIEIGNSRGMKHEKWLELKSSLNLSEGDTFELILPTNGAHLLKCDDLGENCEDVTSQVKKLSGSSGSSIWEIPVSLGFTTYNAAGSEAYVPTNVTINNAPPYVKDMLLADVAGGLTIDLQPDTSRLVWCNGTIVDDNGYQHISKANATLFKASVAPDAADDNNTHYTNGSCDLSSGTGTSKEVYCSFQVWYYADADSWNCTINAYDMNDSTGFNNTNISINSFLSLDVWNTTIPFGTLGPGDNASTQITEVKNTCNQNINVSLREANWSNAGNGALNCSDATAVSGWIDTSQYVTYNATHTLSSPDNSTTLTGVPVTLQINLPQQTTEGPSGNVTAPVYWGLFVPPGVSGECFGIVEYTAVAG
ncbi:MAG: PKD domain-containing protein [Candidatus Thorarchaeota archaeon]